jgi:putative transposase
MLVTFKVNHQKDITGELAKARRVAEYALKTKSRTSKDVKDIGLPAAISNQILKKYSSNKKLKKIRSVKLTVPNQAIKVDANKRLITIRCLSLALTYYYKQPFVKINQIELDSTYAYISVMVEEKPEYTPVGYLGVDRNTTGHCAVAANSVTGKVIKLSKKAVHVRKKYAALRKELQQKKKYTKLKRIKRRESRIIKDELHKASRVLVNYACQNKLGIKLEKLEGIRKRAKTAQSFKYLLHSWPFYQLGTMIEYKAKLLGVPVVLIDPRYTSQDCSRCKARGGRQGKIFKCHNCGHVDHADVNASFNIALRHTGIGQLGIDRVIPNGLTESPKDATL